MSSTLDIMQAVAGDDGGVPYDLGPGDVSPPASCVAPCKSTKKKHKTKSKTKKKTRVKDDEADDDELFRMISNPEKMLPNPRKTSRGGDKKKKKKRTSSVHSMSSFSDYSSDNHIPSSLGLGSFASGGSVMGGMGYHGEEFVGSQADCESTDERQQIGSKKRKEDIMQEKIEMLTRISKMSKQGFATTKKWGMRDDIDEIRFECYRMTRENNSKKAVKNMQHGLITMATILEFANNMINPFNLKLQGFSRNMMLTVSDYDDSLEAIHHKWSGRTTIGPELTVLFTFATSAVFHHAGNVSSNSAPPTSRQQEAPKPSGGMGLGDMSSMLGMFSNLMPKSGGGGKSPPEPEQATAPVVVPTKRRPMKGPSLPSASMSLP